MLVQPYLNFEGRCEEAIAFYKKALGAEVQFLMRNKEAPEKPPPGMVAPGSDEKILHCSLKIGDSVINASDGACSGKPNFAGITLSLTVANEAEAKARYNALAEGGAVQMPLGKTFFSPSFGMLADCFGVGWIVYVPGQTG